MYEPHDFNPEKMHALKYLWIFERRADLIRDALDNTTFEERIEKLPAAFINATERVQMETGLSTDELRKALFVGTYIAEYREIEKMTEEERDSYINFIESNNGVPEEILEIFGDALSGLAEALDPVELRNDFDNIIRENFDDFE